MKTKLALAALALALPGCASIDTQKVSEVANLVLRVIAIVNNTPDAPSGK